MGNVFSQMKDLYKMQREAKDMQKKLRVEKIAGESDDKKVKLFMNGAQELEDIFIDDSLRNVLQCNKANLPTLLYHTPSTEDFPMFKIYSLDKDEILDTYSFMINNVY